MMLFFGFVFGKDCVMVINIVYVNFCFFFLTLVSFFFWMLLEICMYIDKIFFPQMGLVEGLVSLMLLPLFV